MCRRRLAVVTLAALGCSSSSGFRFPTDGSVAPDAAADAALDAALDAGGDGDAAPPVGDAAPPDAPPPDAAAPDAFVCPAAPAPGTATRSFVLPFVAESPRSALSGEPYAFDSVLTAAVAGGGAATVDVTLYAEGGAQPLLSATGCAVCDPCRLTLDGAGAAQLSFDAAFAAAGGVPGELREGWAHVGVRGPDAAKVALSAQLVNSRASAAARDLAPLPVVPVGGGAAAYALPHLVEYLDSAGGTLSFDTTIEATYAPGLGGTGAGGGARVAIHLYTGNRNTPWRSATQNDICNPCVLSVGPAQRRAVLRLDEQVLEQGGFDQPIAVLHGVAVVSGDDPGGLVLSARTVNTHTRPGDASTVVLAARPLGAATDPRVMIAGRVLERAGRTDAVPGALDGVLVAHYARGLVPELGTARSATLALELFDAAGAPLQVGGHDVCAPCSYRLDPGGRKLVLNLESLIEATGGWGDDSVADGFAVLRVGGLDPGAVSVESWTFNAQTSSRDMTLGVTALAETGAGARTLAAPWIVESPASIAAAGGVDSTLLITYAGAGAGGRVEVHLTDAASGAPLRSVTSEVVCDPCSVELTPAAPHRVLSVAAELERAGGAGGAVREAVARVVVGGDDPAGVVVEGLVESWIGSAGDTSRAWGELVPVEE
jgi:hypothetical protein